jgi:hypothetical protein
MRSAERRPPLGGLQFTARTVVESRLAGSPSPLNQGCVFLMPSKPAGIGRRSEQHTLIFPVFSAFYLTFNNTYFVNPRFKMHIL